MSGCVMVDRVVEYSWGGCAVPCQALIRVFSTGDREEWTTAGVPT